MSILTYSWFMEAQTLHAPLDALSAANRPQGIEIATLTTFDIPALAVLTLEAYDDDVTPEALLETSEELRLTFEGAFGATTEDSFIGAWDGGTLVGAILVVRESPWDDAPDGPFVVDLIVAPDYRRRGIATALVSEVASRWYVYHRTDRPCLRCSTPIREALMQNRRLFWCPSCQR